MADYDGHELPDTQSLLTVQLRRADALRLAVDLYGPIAAAKNLDPSGEKGFRDITLETAKIFDKWIEDGS